MSFQQIRDILKNIGLYHDELRALIVLVNVEKDNECENDWRREWLKTNVESQSRLFASTLFHLQSECDQRILDIWLQYIPDEEIRRSLMQMKASTNPDWEELLEHVQGVDQALHNLCVTLADQSSVSEHRDLFETLGRELQSFLQQTTWGMRSEITWDLQAEGEIDIDDVISDPNGVKTSGNHSAGSEPNPNPQTTAN